MPIHIIKAYPETCEVSVYQKSKTVWVASGTFMNEPLTVSARSESSAARQWQEIAESRYRSS